jgi:hypothetical protein
MVSVTKPRAKIRRFDVFAEYTRLEQRRDVAPADVSKGYAIWLAKVERHTSRSGTKYESSGPSEKAV